jgi:hypothetical protein
VKFVPAIFYSAPKKEIDPNGIHNTPIAALGPEEVRVRFLEKEFTWQTYL